MVEDEDESLQNSLNEFKNVLELNLTDNEEENRKFLIGKINELDEKPYNELKRGQIDLISKYFRYEKGKFPAPPWLMYPTYSSFTIGWRMGSGENYRTNFFMALRDQEEFDKYFPKPPNWRFTRIEEFSPNIQELKSLPLFGDCWNKYGKPLYTLKGLEEDYYLDDNINIWDKISLSDDLFVIKKDLIHSTEYGFHYNSFKFTSIAHGLLASKILYFNNHVDIRSSYDELKDLNIEFSQEEEEIWEKIQYTVFLNVLYYSAMSNESLKNKLFNTKNKVLAYFPGYDDPILGVYFDGEESVGDNLIGFALMEVRYELMKLYEHVDLIDWEYTNFIEKCNFYIFNPYDNEKDSINLSDEQSPEYKIYEATYNNLKYLVRDVDLSPEIEDKYVKGEILQEKGFTDASSKIGKITASHRFLILSNQMKDLSSFEHDTDWGLYTAANDSKFKVLDVYEYNGKTQITLLHLLDLWEIFKDDTTINEDVVESARENFRKSFNMEPVSSLMSDTWKDRCKYPIGLDNDGNYFKLDD